MTSTRNRLARLEEIAVTSGDGPDADLERACGWALTRLTEDELRWLASLRRHGGELSPDQQREWNRLEAKCT